MLGPAAAWAPAATIHEDEEHPGVEAEQRLEEPMAEEDSRPLVKLIANAECLSILLCESPRRAAAATFGAREARVLKLASS